jgi:hypothetical protein
MAPVRRRRGQATVELAMMLPIIASALFLCVELAFFFGSTSYVQYATFAAARAQQAGEDANAVGRMLMSGGLVERGTLRASASGGTVSVRQRWAFDLPFLAAFGNLDYELTAVAGIDEEKYEGRAGGNAARYADNQCRRRC